MATLQIFRHGHWQSAMEIKVTTPEAGYRSPSMFGYTMDYFVEHGDHPQAAAIACQYPLRFDTYKTNTWPAFLLDILPSGAGRRHWLTRLSLPDAPSADWQLLLNGGGHPPGNLRIAEAVTDMGGTITPRPDGQLVATKEHPGFTREQILERREHFIEYAAALGAQVAGCSDIQGVAPKFMLVQDHEGLWHAEGAIPDQRVAASWIVKFPRGRTAADRKVLANEAAYMAVAQACGLHANQDVHWENDCLFIRRFDRRVAPSGALERFGMESLYSLAGVAEYGAAVKHDDFCRALIRYVSDPVATLTEYVKRDCLNIMLGNKDNHGRNTAVFRFEDGTVELTPLFDFAPMYLDPEGIARVCRWSSPLEQGGQPDWAKVIEALPGLAPSTKRQIRGSLADWGRSLANLVDTMAACGVDHDIIEARLLSINVNLNQLAELAPATLLNGPSL